jgi:hypothetical protein
MRKILSLFIVCFLLMSHNIEPKNHAIVSKSESKFDTINKTIHVFVALCDNKYQGIVPVPAKIGNGQDPNNNLYWGCGYGIKTYFKKSKEWKLIKTQKLDNIKLERLIFKHISKNYYLVADAYDGQYIKQCTIDFLQSNSGQIKETIKINNTTIGIYGNAKLNAYIGHDGLMDFKLTENFDNTDNKKRNCIILACVSKTFFAPHLKATKSNPIVWTTGLMCPEAYTVHDAISGFIDNQSDENIRNRAAMAYSKYQKCSLKFSRSLLVTGY